MAFPSTTPQGSDQVVRSRRSRTHLPSSCVHLGCLVLIVTAFACGAFAQKVDPALYGGMRWRQVGPFRAGRVSAVAGIPGNAAVYYMGTPGGGVWKTVDGGVVWAPISDDVHVASIGALAVAPSDPKIIYMGTGDVSNVGGSVNYGNGVYRSMDEGKTWQHVGLEGTEKIGALWIDPGNPDVVILAALGQTFARSEQRGVFKTSDGGKSWRKVLYKDDTIGAVDIVFDPANPNTGFATLWTHYTQPGEARAQIDANGGGSIWKTSDGGESWKPVGESGLPVERMGRIGVAVAPGGERVYAIIAARRQAGLYRSDNGGTSWQKITGDPRIQGSGYFSKIFLDPHNPDIVYVAQTSLYRSIDAGRTFIAYKGAPGGDDNHVLWIDPTNSNRMILGSDQGATISMDGGKSWSSWYNQPTGQIYHLSTDNRFPYWIYGTQQDSGSVATLSRGDYGNITFLDWDPIGGYEFGYIVPDPKDPNVVFAGGPGRGLVRIDRQNRQVVTVSPNVSRDGDYRMAVNPPLAFSPQNSHALYMASQVLLETTDNGATWKPVSPDLTRRPGRVAEQTKAEGQQQAEANPKKPKTREEEATVRPPDRSAINSFAISPVKSGIIWVGTTNGIVQLTKDGGASWRQVSPPKLSEHEQVSMIEASHFQAASAYAAVDSFELNDFRPHIFRTHDFGVSWKETDDGIADGDFVRVVREDPVRKGLLYAGTENGAYVSFDDGDHWNSLQLNLPTVSVRDLAVHGDDLVAGTYGRAFWILDDLSPLRQASRVGGNEPYLFHPGRALRVQLDLNRDTPLPPEMPAGDNPPNGAIIDYYLPRSAKGELKLVIYDTKGQLVREFSNTPEPPSSELPPNVPSYWLFNPQPLPDNRGMNRVVWDLRYSAPPTIRHEYPISALYEDTPGEPQGALVVPGTYKVRLTVDGRLFEQTLDVAMDPRVKTSASELVRQLELDKKIDELLTSTHSLYRRAQELRKSLADREKEVLGANADVREALPSIKDVDQKTLAIEGEEQRSFTPGKPKPTFVLLNQELGGLSTTLESADAAPTSAMESAYGDYCHDLTRLVADWNALLTTDLQKLNAALESKHAEALSDPPEVQPPACQIGSRRLAKPEKGDQRRTSSATHAGTN
jgi:photosystem II stability/assembly factor-like uncharacterized protein